LIVVYLKRKGSKFSSKVINNRKEGYSLSNACVQMVVGLLFNIVEQEMQYLQM